ncbi:MAG: hypothetical protein JSV91_02280 [Phycisphaerales bacterium]|nr:MAG: hypothetical protein JSV91_02280 [Phycisphaerales bacterium]
MADPQDTIEIDGRRLPTVNAPPEEETSKGPRRKFLSVHYRCCHAYGRLYRNAAGTAYEGRCPCCGAAVRALIGPHGTNQRTFRTT